MIRLPKFSLVANPIYLPDISKNRVSDLIYGNCSSGLYLSSLYCESKSKSGSVEIESFGYNVEFIEGSLFARDVNLFGFKSSFRPVGLEVLLNRKYLEEFNYGELFDFLNVEFDDKIFSWIPETCLLYRVTELGDYNIALGKKKGKKKFVNSDFGLVKKPNFGLGF